MQRAWTSGIQNRVERFEHMVSKAPPHSLSKLATSSYSAVPQLCRLELKKVLEIANLDHGNRIQVILLRAGMPKEVATSRQTAHFYLKRYIR